MIAHVVTDDQLPSSPGIRSEEVERIVYPTLILKEDKTLALFPISFDFSPMFRVAPRAWE